MGVPNKGLVSVKYNKLLWPGKKIAQVLKWEKYLDRHVVKHIKSYRPGLIHYKRNANQNHDEIDTHIDPVGG